MRNALDINGRKCADRVSGFSGTATSVCFDLYGCVQVCVTPEVTKDNSKEDARWFDIGRLDVKQGTPRVMTLPSYEDAGPNYIKGPESSRPAQS